MHTGDSKEIVSHAYPGVAYKSYIYWLEAGTIQRSARRLLIINNLTCAPRPGGTHIGKGYGDVPRSWPHFFRPVAAPGRRSLAYQFTVNAPLLCPLFSIFRKFLHFQPCFSQNFSSLDPNFSKFSFPRPQFFKEKPLPIPYILKPAWHTATKKKKKLSAPQGGKDAYNLLLICINLDIKLSSKS